MYRFALVLTCLILASGCTKKQPAESETIRSYAVSVDYSVDLIEFYQFVNLDELPYLKGHGGRRNVRVAIYNLSDTSDTDYLVEHTLRPATGHEMLALSGEYPAAFDGMGRVCAEGTKIRHNLKYFRHQMLYPQIKLDKTGTHYGVGRMCDNVAMVQE